MGWTIGVDWEFWIVAATALLFSLSFHESAHAWSADLLGDRTARLQGRVTLNPIAHIDLFGTLIFPLLCAALNLVVFGWAKPVPVDGRQLSQPKRDHLLIAAAGPASNLLLAAVLLLILKGLVGLFPNQLDQGHAVLTPLYRFCRIGISINAILAVFNLFPIPPLDGSWILEGLLPDVLSRLVAALRPYGFILLVVFLYTGWLGSVLRPVLVFVNRLAL